MDISCAGIPCLCQKKTGNLSCNLIFRYKHILLCFNNSGEVGNSIIHLESSAEFCFKMLQFYLKLNLLTRKLMNLVHLAVEPGTKEGGCWIN